MDVMNFLNEATERYANAISFAAGRPPNHHVTAERMAEWVARFVRERAQAENSSEEAVWRALGQYGPSAGIIGGLVARWLARDEGLHPADADLLITNGVQEGLFLLLLSLCDGPRDVVLSDDPTYVGLAGAAQVARVATLIVDGNGPLLERTERALARAATNGQTARAMYLVPDFANPSGNTLTLSERLQLLELAKRKELLLLEDVTYRAFRYRGEQLPTLKALDTEELVVQLGSFSKIFLPGCRIGYLYGGQRVQLNGQVRSTLVHELSKAKSFVSVLTSSIAQATVGGFLLEQDFSLSSWNRPRVEACKENCQLVLQSLERNLPNELRGRLSWSDPEGGFFLTMKLPFRFRRAEMLACAQDYGLIVCPLADFTENPDLASGIRLSFSNLAPGAAHEGVSRLYRFVTDKLRSSA